MGKKYLPNQSGTFGNRVNFHDAETEEKSFVVEFYTEDLHERKKVISLVRAALGSVTETYYTVRNNC